MAARSTKAISYKHAVAFKRRPRGYAMNESRSTLMPPGLPAVIQFSSLHTHTSHKSADIRFSCIECRRFIYPAVSEFLYRRTPFWKHSFSCSLARCIFIGHRSLCLLCRESACARNKGSARRVLMIFMGPDVI